MPVAMKEKEIEAVEPKVEAAPEPMPVQVQIPLEPADLQPLYANFARVTSSPEELVLDFGLNPQPFGGPSIPVKVSERLVVNYYTAKRLWVALGMALQRHEVAFGVLETDVNKRVVAR